MSVQRCPKCSSPDFEATTMGIIGGRDTNRANCKCGWKGEVWMTSIAGLLFFAKRVCEKHSGGSLDPTPGNSISIVQLEDAVEYVKSSVML